MWMMKQDQPSDEAEKREPDVFVPFSFDLLFLFHKLRRTRYLICSPSHIYKLWAFRNIKCGVPHIFAANLRKSIHSKKKKFCYVRI